MPNGNWPGKGLGVEINESHEPASSQSQRIVSALIAICE